MVQPPIHVQEDTKTNMYPTTILIGPALKNFEIKIQTPLGSKIESKAILIPLGLDSYAFYILIN